MVSRPEIMPAANAPARPAAASRAQAIAEWRSRVPGAAAIAAATLAAALLAQALSAPAMLIALLCGMAVNPVFSARPALAPGVSFCARSMLRLGIVLLGARVTLAEMASLGAPVIALAVGGVAATIGLGWLLGRALGLRSDHALLSAGAVAICGASAALAISSALPRRAGADRDVMVTILGVTTLSTAAMVLYPLLTNALGIDERAAGVFLGASIHDVAQVVAAGFMISPKTAEIATVVKLTRVLCLAPAVAMIGMMFRSGEAQAGAAKRLPVPPFVIGFLVLVLARSSGAISEATANVLTTGSQWLLLVSVTALGAKTSLKDVLAPGPRPLLALVLITLLLGAIALAGALLLP